MPLVHPAILSGGNENHGQPLNVDTSGNLLVNIAQGSFAVTTGAQYNSTPPTLTSGTTGPLQCDQNGKMLISGSINATSAATYNSSVQTMTNGSSNAMQADVHGALMTSPRDTSGAAMGVLANALRVDPTGTTTQPVSISGSVPVTGTFWQATQPVSAASLPLPAGAATSAKQPALGTAGAASADVLTVQGIASMTALKVDGSAVTQPVSGTVAVSGSVPVTGTFWQATQPISGTVTVQQGTASSLKVDLSGTAANATALKVDGSAVTQPVSGTFWQATQPVSIAATVNAALTPKTTGGLTATKLISAATTNATSVKASAGQVYNIQAFNTNAAARYLKLYNKASAPTVGTDTPVATYLLPGASAGAGLVVEIANGLAFGTGIAFALTTGIADADTGAVGAAEVVVNLQYA